jgi:hypothetical protein
MDQRALGRLAEELAPLAQEGTPEAAGKIGQRIRTEARRLHVAPWTLTNMIAAEWLRLGITRRAPVETWQA